MQTSVDLTSTFPSPGDQGKQESCTGWAIAYALKTHQEQVKRNWGIGTYGHRFSPSYIYNQINDGKNQSVLLSKALDVIKNQGVCPYSYFPYSESNYTSQPTTLQKTSASLYKAKDWHTIIGIDNIKMHLASGDGVIVGTKIYADLKNLNSSNQVFDNISGTSSGGHAICLIGYDDNKGGGSFKFINSWGTSWGVGGYGWISYDVLKKTSSVTGLVATGYVIENKTTFDHTMGDLNGDGLVKTTDARLALQITVNIGTSTAMQKVLADVNYDATVTATDARTILRVAVKIVPPIS